MSEENGDELLDEDYIDLVWQLGDGIIDPPLDQVLQILAACGKTPDELSSDICEYRERAELLEIYERHVRARADGFFVDPDEFSELLGSLGKERDDFYRDVLDVRLRDRMEAWEFDSL